MNKPKAVIVFGSALTDPNPRDIDVIVVGDISDEQVKELVADQFLHLIKRGIPLDLHRQSCGGAVVPCCMGKIPQFAILHADGFADGFVPIQFADHTGVASVIRSTSSPKEVERHLGSWFEVSLLPSERSDAWAEYIQGPRALASALRKNPNALEGLPYGELLRTVASFPDIGKKLREQLEPGQGGGSTVTLAIDVRQDTNGDWIVTTKHDLQTRWSLKDFTKLLRG